MLAPAEAAVGVLAGDAGPSLFLPVVNILSIDHRRGAADCFSAAGVVEVCTVGASTFPDPSLCGYADLKDSMCSSRTSSRVKRSDLSWVDCALSRSSGRDKALSTGRFEFLLVIDAAADVDLPKGGAAPLSPDLLRSISGWDSVCIFQLFILNGPVVELTCDGATDARKE